MTDDYRAIIECVVANSPDGYPKMENRHWVADTDSWNHFLAGHIIYNGITDSWEWNSEDRPVIIEDHDYIYLYFKSPDGSVRPVACSTTYPGDGKIKNKAMDIKPEFMSNGVVLTDTPKRYANVTSIKEDKPATTHYTIRDFYNYICSGDRPDGGDYYLGFCDNEWSIQIYTGRTQVNFNMKNFRNEWTPVGNMVFYPEPTEEMIAGEVKFAKVKNGVADYDHMISYPMDIEVDRINWTTALGFVGNEIMEVIIRTLKNR